MHVIVTGAASGIGQASALRLSRRMKVSIADLDMDGAQQTVEMIRAQGGDAQAIECDVSSRASVFSMADQARKTFGAVDCLFANAGINRRAPVDDILATDWDLMMNIHVKGMMFAAQASIPDMLASGKGAIVNTASDFSIMGVAGNATYTSAKTAIYSLTKAMACEFTARGICVNAIGPGPIDTPLLAKGRTPEQHEALLERFASTLPMRRMGKPEDVAFVVDFLLSERATYISGQLVHPNGGQLMW